MAISKVIKRVYQRLYGLSPFGTFALLMCLGTPVVGFVMEWIRADRSTNVQEILIEVGKMEAGVIGMMLWLGFFFWATNRTKSARLRKILFALIFLGIPPVIGVAMGVAVLIGRAEISTYEIFHTVIGGELVTIGIFAMPYAFFTISDWIRRRRNGSSENDVIEEIVFDFGDDAGEVTDPDSPKD